MCSLERNSTMSDLLGSFPFLLWDKTVRLMAKEDNSPSGGSLIVKIGIRAACVSSWAMVGQTLARTLSPKRGGERSFRKIPHRQSMEMVLGSKSNDI